MTALNLQATINYIKNIIQNYVTAIIILNTLMYVAMVSVFGKDLDPFVVITSVDTITMTES